MKLDEARTMIGRTASHSWLSGLRNDLQYKHRYGVWFPKQVRAASRLMLSRMVLEWLKDPIEIDLDRPRMELIGEFVSCCTFIVALCRVMLGRIADRSVAGPRSFVALGPLAFLNDAQLLN
jgi:hypothetical protein